MTSLVYDVVLHDGRVEDLVDQARYAWGVVREDPFPFTSAQFRTAIEDLRTLRDQWAATPAGEVLDVEWPRGLVTATRARSR